MRVLENTPNIPVLAEYEAAYAKHVRAGDYFYRKHLDIRNPVNLLDEALNEYYRALELKPDCPILLGKIARIFLRQGQYIKAEQMARRVLLTQPKSADAYYVLGFTAFKKRHYQKSIRDLQKAVQYGGWMTSRFRFCLYYSYLEAAQEAQNPFQSLGAILQAYYHFVIAACTGKLEAEPSNLFQMIHILPGMLKAYFKEQAQDADGAFSEYTKLYESFPGLPPVMNMMASHYARKGMMEEAFEWLERAIARDSSSEDSYFQLAALFEDQGDYKQVLPIYQTLMRLKPEDPQIHCSLGNAYSSLNQYEEAISHYKAAMQLSTDRHWNALIAQTLANLYQEVQHNPEAAQVAFQEAIALNPSDITNYIHLGILYFERGDFTNAQIIYEKAVQLDPENPRIRSNIGYLKWLQGDIEEAVEHYQLSIRMDPLYDIPHNNLGVIQLDVLGNVLMAIELLERAVSLNENYALAFYNLGRAYSFVERKTEAAMCFQKAQILNEYTKELDHEELAERINHLFDL